MASAFSITARALSAVHAPEGSDSDAIDATEWYLPEPGDFALCHFPRADDPSLPGPLQRVLVLAIERKKYSRTPTFFVAPLDNRPRDIPLHIEITKSVERLDLDPDTRMFTDANRIFALPLHAKYFPDYIPPRRSHAVPGSLPEEGGVTPEALGEIIRFLNVHQEAQGKPPWSGKHEADERHLSILENERKWAALELSSRQAGTTVENLPDSARHAGLKRRCPEPGDLVTCILPGHAPEEDARIPNLALLLDVRDDVTYGVPVYTVTPVMPRPPAQMLGKPNREFFQRVQGKIFPLKRSGDEVVNAMDVIEVPVITTYFPELPENPLWWSEAALTLRGSVEKDWLQLIVGLGPATEDRNRSLLEDLRLAQSHVADEVEEEYRRSAAAGLMSLFGRIPSQQDYEP